MKSDQKRSHKAITATSTEASVLSEPTPGPWKLSGPSGSGRWLHPAENGLISSYSIFSATPGAAPSGYCPIATLTWHEMDTRGKSDAELIVCAVNHHDALVKALEEARDALLTFASGAVHETLIGIDDALNSVRASS